jgi:hypothetical protein
MITGSNTVGVLEGESTFTYDQLTALISVASATNPVRYFVTNTSTGDAQYSVTAGAQTYSFGVDNSNADVFSFVLGETLGSSEVYAIPVTGDISWLRGFDMGDNNIKTVMDITMSGQLDGNGTANINNFNEINANTKNFDIEHPVKGDPWRLQYTSLEGPEAGVYLRGETTNNVIEFPNYWTGLVHEDSITVQLTPIGSPCVHFVVKIEDNKVFIDCEDGQPNCYYLIQAKRKDINGPKLEYIKE